MIGKLLEALAGRDDLERVARRNDPVALDTYLKSRTVFIPRRPERLLDASILTREQLLEMIRKESEEMTASPFEPWILEVDGKRRLPAFTSQKRMDVFAREISQQMNKVFALGCAEGLLPEITRGLDIDFVDLNLFCSESWEIGVRK